MLFSRSVRSIHAEKIVAMSFALLALLVLPSCWVFSIHSLFDGASDPDLVFDQKLIGSWAHLAEECEWILTMEASARAYDMKIAPGEGCTKEKKNSDRYWGYLVKLDNNRFLDVAPGPDQSRACILCLPVHSFALLSLENNNNTLVTTPLDLEWLDQSIKNKKVVLDHLGGGDNDDIDITVTAQPAALKDLLRRCVNDKAAFKPSLSLAFTKK